MQPAQIQTTAVDGKFPPPSLCGERGEGEKQGGGGGEGNRHEDPGKQREASREIAARATTRAGARPACSECEDRETVRIAADLVYKGPE